jgi:hypothetical protein
VTVVLAQNEKDTLPVDVAVADLRAVLLETKPDLGVLNEWPKSRDAATRKMCTELGYGYDRPRAGGPVIWRLAAHRLRTLKDRRLALPEFVGHLPGRRSRLGTSWCTEAVFDNLEHAGDHAPHKTCLLGAHLTAEIQDMKAPDHGYKRGLEYFFRVRRHKREKRRWGRLGRRHLHRGDETYPAGDTNFDGMQLGGFANCWDGFPGGDLGGRAVTIVYANAKPAHRPRTVQTHSDHFAVAVTYPQENR